NLRGILAAEADDPAAALADFDAALALSPDDPAGFFNRGLARLRLLDEPGTEPVSCRPARPDDAPALEAALADFDTALRHEPDNLRARLSRGFLRRRRGDLDGALADFD